MTRDPALLYSVALENLLRRGLLMKIVRLVCFFAAALLVSQQTAFAQDAPAFGVMVGLNESYYATSPENETTKKPGALIGVFGVLRRDKGFKILPELQSSQRKVDMKLRT